MPFLITPLYVLAALLAASLGLVELRLVVRFLRNRMAIREAVRSRRSVLAGGAGGDVPPTVTIQLPLYNECFAAEQVIRATAAQDYPRDRFDIQVLDDSTDETSEIVAGVVFELQESGVRIEHIRRETRSGYKAGALAEGLTRSDADFVAVFDADFSPGPDFLQKILIEADVFDDPSVAFVQTRWAWDRPVRGVFLSGLALLLDRHFFIQKPTRVFAGHVTTFNGSGGVWRRAAIDDAGGWSADTLTEDLDLSYRCAMKGWRGHYLHDLSVPNELPEHMRAFKLQQRRWARGSAQCFRKLTSRVLSSGSTIHDPIEEAFLLAGYAIHPILLTNLVLWPLAVLYMNRNVFLVMQGLMAIAALAAPLSLFLTLRERDSEWNMNSVGQVLAGMCVGLGLMVNNTVAQLQGFLLSEGEFARTPKGTRRSVDGSVAALATGLYRSPLHWTFFLEVLVVAYSGMASAILVMAGEALWALPLLFWGLCVGLVVKFQLSAQPA
jgi:cellulose synthase/poly-beta-1,6-N-acetylglucosamine synthase-like glycosyltransferase